MRQTTGIILLEFLTGTVLLVGMLFGLVAWRLVSGPVDLDFAKAEIEQALSRAREGRRVEIGSVSLQWEQQDNRFQIIADKLDFYGEEGQAVGATDRALIGLSAASLVRGRAEISYLVLEGGHLTVERRNDGEIHVADHTIPAADPFLLEDDANPFRIVELTILNIVDRVGHTEAIDTLERVALRDFSVELVDQPFDIAWSMDNVSLSVSKIGREINITGDGDAFGEGAPERVELNGNLNLEDMEMSVSIALLEQSLPDFPLLSLLPVPVEGRAPSDIIVQMDVTEQGFQQIAFNFEGREGLLKIGEREMELGRNDITLQYDPIENSFVLDARDLDFDLVKGSALVVLSDALAWFEFPFRELHPVTADISELELNLRPVFEDVWTFQDAKLAGHVDLSTAKLLFDDFEVAVGEAVGRAQGEIYLQEKPVDGDLPFGVRLTAATEGVVSPEDVLRFWPLKLGGVGRQWVVENVKQGRLFDADFKLDLSPDSLRDQTLDNEELRLDFAFEDAVVTFLSDLPGVVNGRGQARLEGNAFSLDVEAGQFSKWDLDSGRVQITRFHPEDGELILTAKGRGPVTEMLQTFSDSRLQLSEKYGLQVQNITGYGEGNFSYRRILGNSHKDDIGEFAFTGRADEAGFVDFFSDLDIAHGFATVDVSNEDIRVSGYGQLEDTPIEFEWANRFTGEDEDRTTLNASGRITPDMLNRFGIAVRAYLSGDVLTQFRASGPSLSDLSKIDIDFDLTNNRIDLSEVGWVKLPDEEARARLFSRTTGANRKTIVAIQAEGFDFSGDISTDETGGVRSIKLERLFLEDQMELHGALTQARKGGLQIDVSGPFLNAGPLLDGVFAGGQGSLPLFGDIQIQSRIDELRLKAGLSFEDVNLALAFSGPILDVLSLDGTDNEGSRVIVDLSRGEEESERLLKASVEDSGSLFRGLFGNDFVQGGKLTAEGVLRTGEAQSDLKVKIKNARLKSAPLLTQILSLASLRGLTDVMSGEGILFTDVELPMRIDPRGFYLDGVKASGPAMGLTANGHILDDGEVISLDGVLVPSFGVNSALGGIPIFGDLFVSRQGEGVFAITYGVRGSMESAKVSVNPLAGLVPGVLRRIFENPTSTEIPELSDPVDNPEPVEP